MSKSYPRLFNGAMMCALLAGRKSQTRQPVVGNWLPIVEEVMRANGHWTFSTLGYDLTTPFGGPGDEIWIRETFLSCRAGAVACRIADATYVCYRDGAQKRKGSEIVRPWTGTDSPKWEKGYHKFSPNIHMPQWASRITLPVLRVWVERIQDISREDAIAEGLAQITKDDGYTWKHGIPDSDGLPGTDDYGWPWSEWTVNPKDAFRTLWDSIYADKGLGWKDNPWVFAAEFQKLTP